MICSSETRRSSCWFNGFTTAVYFIVAVAFMLSDARAQLVVSGSAGPTDSSVTLTWTAPGDDGAVGTAVQYAIRYSTSLITEANWAQASPAADVPGPKPAGSSESFSVRGLNSETTYYFAIRAADEVPNWSGLSNIVCASTVVDQTPGSAIQDLDAEAGALAGYLDISWTAPGDDGNIGTATTYVVKASSQSITEANWNAAMTIADPPTPLESGSSQAWTIAGLVPGGYYYVAMKSIDNSGNVSAISNVAYGQARVSLVLDTDDESASLPVEFCLAQNYPNPFNPITTIEYSVPEASQVRLSVYNIQGQLTVTLVDETQAAGHYTVYWEGADAGRAPVASGVYFYRLEAGDFAESRKMVLLK